ncbi:hypothetical protein ACFVUS_00685 [Nocardia sp. NPDC058058]|uniref:hypothetical protein n=1 Tax=Nocardia sp. NPDC058058 TaxID=3346317 RepID=UPI0036D8352D
MPIQPLFEAGHRIDGNPGKTSDNDNVTQLHLRLRNVADISGRCDATITGGDREPIHDIGSADQSTLTCSMKTSPELAIHANEPHRTEKSTPKTL